MTARPSLEALPLARTICDLIADQEQSQIVINGPLGVVTGHLPFGPIMVLRYALHPIDWLPWVVAADRSIRKAFYDPVAEVLNRTIGAEREAHGDVRGTVFLAGHGLAGALAALAAFELSQSGQKVLLVTFGQPAVFRSDETAPELRGWLRFVHAGDAIPELLHGYVHPTPAEILGDAKADHPTTLDGLLSRIERTRASRRLGEEGLSSLAQSVEGLEPGLVAHRLEEYRAEIARQDRLHSVPLPALDKLTQRSGKGFETAVTLQDVQLDNLRQIRGIGPRIETLLRDLGVNSIGQIASWTWNDINLIGGLVPGMIGRVLRDNWVGQAHDLVTNRTWLPHDRLQGRNLPSAADPVGTESVQQSPGSTRAATGASAGRGIPVLVALHRRDWNPPPWLRTLTAVEEYRAAIVPKDRLKELRADPQVYSVEISREAGTLELGRSVPLVRGDVVQRPDIDERGALALFGLIDTGIDILHKAFDNPDGVSRIIAVWHQAGASGFCPNDVDPAFDASFGTLYTARDIERFRRGPPEEIPRVLRDLASGNADSTSNGHGTHVAAIGAGRGVGNACKGSGMAPEAEIIVVVPHVRTEPGAPPSIGYSASHVSALAFLRRVSQGGNSILAEASPIAVNISMGMNAGAHDGMTPLETAIDVMTYKGKLGGFVIVKSAGNEARTGRHRRVTLSNTARSVEWELDASSSELSFYLEGWYSHRHRLDFTLSAPEGTGSLCLSGIGVALGIVGKARCRMEIDRYNDDNADTRLAIEVKRELLPLQTGIWKLRIAPEELRGTDRNFDIWFENDRPGGPEFGQPDAEVTLTVPGTADTVICVGACDTEALPGLAETSSAGPTRTSSKVKPDLLAPGVDIVAALAATDDPDALIARSGTSMAAPHVTGAVVLAMSALARTGGSLNTNTARAMLCDTTLRNDGNHDIHAGYGVVNTEAFLRRALDNA